MKMFSIWGLCLFAALATTHRAQAQFFVEPYATYEQGKANFKSGIINFDGDMKGIGIGARVGGHVNDVLFLALDTQYAEPEFTSSLYNTKTKSLLAGLTVGAQTPYAGLRVWGSYLPVGTLDQARSNGLQMKFSEPEMIKLGVGLRVAAFSINLERLSGKYKKSEIQNDASTFAAFDNADATRETYMLGVSFPFSL